MSVRYDFTGKTILVTGSSRGMGATILEAFARAEQFACCNTSTTPAGKTRRMPKCWRNLRRPVRRYILRMPMSATRAKLKR